MPLPRSPHSLVLLLLLSPIGSQNVMMTLLWAFRARAELRHVRVSVWFAGSSLYLLQGLVHSTQQTILKQQEGLYIAQVPIRREQECVLWGNYEAGQAFGIEPEHRKCSVNGAIYYKCYYGAVVPGAGQDLAS